MTDAHPVLLAPNGRPITKDHGSEGRGLRIMTADGSRLVFARGDLRGAEPKNWDHKLYLDMYYKHPTVFAAINKIVKSATNTGYDFVPRDSRTKANEAEIKRAKKFFQRQHDFIGELRRVYRDLLIFGDAYLYVIPDRKKRPVKLKRLAPWTIHIKAKDNGEVQFYVQKDPTSASSNEKAVVFQPHEILHFKLDDPGNDLYGVSPLESLKTTITTDLHMLNFQKQFFANGASMGTFIIVEEASDAELERTRLWVRDEFVGSNNAYKPVILGGKGIKIEKGVASHEDMSFLEGRNFIIEEILSALDVPPAKIGRMESANRSNSKEQDKSFRTEAIAPLQYTVEAIINDGFMRGILGCEDTLFEHSQSDVRDAQEQMDLWVQAVRYGLLSINEVRNKMGHADVDGGEIPFVMTPTGAVPVDRMDLYFKLPQMNVDQIPEVPRSPSGGEPIPPDDSVDQVGLKPTSKALKPGLTLSLNGAAICLKQAREDRAALRQAFAYARDAADETEHPLIHQFAHALNKALKTDDDDLQTAYLERAEGFISQLVLYDEGMRDAA